MAVQAIRLDRLLSSLGYCTRKEVRELVRAGRITVQGVPAHSWDDKVLHEDIEFDNEPLDPPFGTVLMLNKPAGFVCSRKETTSGDRLVYELLPYRYGHRNPAMVSVGRLDKDTTGLLLFTDDGHFVHALTSPRRAVPKLYAVTLAEPLRGDEVELFAKGEFRIGKDEEPLLPATLVVLDGREVRLTIIEGRYRQIRRMFEVVGNEVVKLHRLQVGDLTLNGLAEGDFRILLPDEVEGLLGKGTNREIASENDRV